MNKKTVIFGSIFTIFILVMMPNLSAIEFNTVKDVYTENTNLMISQTTTILDKFHLSDSMLNLLIILTAILQGLLMIGSLELYELFISNTDYPILGLFISFIIIFSTGFFLSNWNSSFKENNNLTEFQELFLDSIPWLLYYGYIILRSFNIFKDRSDKFA